MPEQLPLHVVSQSGRILTAKLDMDMTGTWLLQARSSVRLGMKMWWTWILISLLHSSQGRRVEFDGGNGSGTVLWQRIPLIFILRDDDGADGVEYSSAVIQPRYTHTHTHTHTQTNTHTHTHTHTHAHTRTRTRTSAKIQPVCVHVCMCVCVCVCVCVCIYVHVCVCV